MFSNFFFFFFHIFHVSTVRCTRCLLELSSSSKNSETRQYTLLFAGCEKKTLFIFLYYFLSSPPVGLMPLIKTLKELCISMVGDALFAHFWKGCTLQRTTSSCCLFFCRIVGRFPPFDSFFFFLFYLKILKVRGRLTTKSPTQQREKGPAIYFFLFCIPILVKRHALTRPLEGKCKNETRWS